MPLRPMSVLRATLVAIALVLGAYAALPSSAQAVAFPRSQNIAFLPSAAGQTNNGGRLPASGFPGGYNPSFTDVPLDSVRDAAADPLASGYDTVVLNGVCDIASYLSNPQFKSRLEGFASRGGKLIIWDSECQSTDYSNFAIPFATNNPGQAGANGTLTDVEENTLSSSAPSSASYVDTASVSSGTDAVGDANVFTTFDPRWFIDLRATNVSGVNGPVQTYARLGSGLVIYSGLDKDSIGTSFDPASTSGSDQLARIWMLELLQPWNPDNLPGLVPVVPRPPPSRPGGTGTPSPVVLVPPSPVVLVPGLDAKVGELLRPTQRDCSKAGDFAALCNTLKGDSSRPVYLIGAKKGGRGLTLDSAGAVDSNARRLSTFMRTNHITNAILVGHSMGGLIARVAVARYAVPAIGLVTLGTPHDGSFAADLLVLASALPCSPFGLSCVAIRSAASLDIIYQGSGAILDLTSVSRWIDNSRLAPLSVPVRMYAGTIIGSWSRPGYALPNDGLVGQTSAWGQNANIGPARACYSARLWHSPFFGSPNLLETPLEKLTAVPCPGKRSAAFTSRVAVPTSSAPRSSPSPAIKLLAARSRRLRVGQRLASARSGPIFSSRAFSVRCAGHVLAAAVLARKLFVLDPVQARCPQATLAGKRSVRVLVTDDNVRARASIERSGQAFKVEVVARQRLKRAYVRSGKRYIKLTVRGRRARIILRGSLGAKQAILTAIIGKRRFTAALPPLS